MDVNQMTFVSEVGLHQEMARPSIKTCLSSYCLENPVVSEVMNYVLRWPMYVSEGKEEM